MLRFPDGRHFATGRASCEIQPIFGERDDTIRIILNVQVEGIPIQAILDTGGVFAVIDPLIARELALDKNTSLINKTLIIRGQQIQGSLHRISLLLPAEQGETMELEVTAFIPNTPDDWGTLPNFLGLTGCLERIRFAVDPQENQFYFAAY